MRDFAFYNAGCSGGRGPRKLVVLARRLLRRVLRPIFFHQEALYRDLQAQVDELSRRRDELSAQVHDLSRQLDAAAAFGWDYVALARRLAALEDHVEALLRADGPPRSAHEGHRPAPAPHARMPVHNNQHEK